MAKIVLCSASPRRRELLRQMGLTDFDVRVPRTAETRPPALSPRALVEHIAREKSDAAAALCAPDEIAVTADTMVFLDGAPLGKPADEADALRMLTALQGREHTVCTGVCVRRGDDVCTRSEETAVRFRTADPAELAAYIRTGEPMDKAGAYGIQGLGALLVEGIRGDYTNVVGLPVVLLARMLGRFGVTFFDGGGRP
jgi:septum formation protein